MCGATTVATSWQLQFPCNCAELPSRWIVVAMSHQMQLPCCVNSTCHVIAVQKKCRMVTKNAGDMVWQIQLPCGMHYICHVPANTVAMMNQLQLPRVYPNVKNAAWQQKNVGHGASNPLAMSSHSSCHHKWEHPKRIWLGQNSNYKDVHRKIIRTWQVYLAQLAPRTW